MSLQRSVISLRSVKFEFQNSLIRSEPENVSNQIKGLIHSDRGKVSCKDLKGV